MATSHKHWVMTMTEWVKSLDEHLRFSRSDTSIGPKYAIVHDATTPHGNEYTQVLTEFMTRNEWFIFRNAINMCGEDSFKAHLKKLTSI